MNWSIDPILVVKFERLFLGHIISTISSFASVAVVSVISII